MLALPNTLRVILVYSITCHITHSHSFCFKVIKLGSQVIKEISSVTAVLRERPDFCSWILVLWNLSNTVSQTSRRIIVSSSFKPLRRQLSSTFVSAGWFWSEESSSRIMMFSLCAQHRAAITSACSVQWVSESFLPTFNFPSLLVSITSQCLLHR